MARKPKSSRAKAIKRNKRKPKSTRAKALKRNKRKRIFKRLLITLCVLAVVGAASYEMYVEINKGYFDVRHIEVIGNEAVDSKAVRGICSSSEGTCIFIVDVNKMVADIESSIKVKSIRITRKFPDTLIVSIEESPVLCAVLTKDNVYYLNGDQKVMEKTDYLERTNVPVLSGLTGMDDENVGTVPILQPEWRSAMAFSILNKLNEDGRLSKISELNCTQNNSFKLITKNNVTIDVKDVDNFTANYEYISYVLDQNQSNMDIDLKNGKNPVVKSRAQ